MNVRWPQRWRGSAAVLGAGLLVSAAAVPAELPCPPSAQALSAEQMAQGLRTARDRGFLWRIEKDGRSSHLYGTVHVARPEWMFPGPTVAAALRASDVIALEIDLLDARQQRRLAAAMAATGAPPLPEALRQRIARLAQRECVDAQRLEGLAPESQVAALMAMSARRDGLDPAYGIDLVLAGFARGAKLPVVSLETPELQAAALRTPESSERDAAVAHALDEIDSGRARPMMLRLARVWADSDHTALANYDEWCECRRNEAERAAMQRLLDARHPALAEAIDALHRGGQRVFAAVGSLHFTGAHALQHLLEQRGYRVEAVRWAR